MEPFQNITMTYKCPKALNELQPCNSNWYCDGCQKMVFDFRGMTEPQILDAFKQSGQMLCGVYDAGSIKVVQQKPRWYKWASAALLLFGLVGCHKQMLGEAELANPKSVSAEKTLEQNVLIGDVAVLGRVGMSPEFTGGEAAWEKYMQRHLHYTADYQGKVYAQFVVERDGSLSDIKIIRGNNEDLNAQIINLLKHSPRWKPATQNGKTYRSTCTVPFNFSLID